MCASFGSTRLMCASFGSTRLICASFGSTRLICAFYGTTRLLCRVRAQRGADRREAGRTREGHMDTSGDDNMEMEDDESIPDINNSDTNTPDDVMNNQSLEQSDSFPQLSPRRKQRQTVADQSEMHPITNKKRCTSKKSNDKEQQSHSKSYKN
ncbi:hypothetical protein E5676_scaffold517G00010 [Cucumis melo var. makuwa]|uniref:Uncharacterized protein n=1 Tax=Cucumis melo var. makuwa TaxID=1194695 RepID=A0A5D3BRN7_CUCMM|nr:hypothetical protein E5676_scaffold517G00010 [Cucumis melo var. makuwa]